VVACALFIVVLVLGVVWYRWAHAPVALVISKETTFVTEPLRADGTVDYLGALNRRNREGVTPENNGAVLFWQAMGPGEIESQHRQEFFRQLGISPLAEEGEYFVPLDKFVRRNGEPKAIAKAPGDPPDASKEDDTKQLSVAMITPWSSKDYPVLAEWLTGNEKPMSLLAEASRRPRWFNPLIPEGAMVIGALLPSNMRSRDIARAFVARAMLRVESGQLDEAWQDLLTCHRLARLCAQGPTLIDGLVGLVVEGLACDGDQALLQYAALSKDQLQQFRNDLNQLGRMPGMSDKIDWAERFFFLDSALTISRDGPDAAEKMLKDIRADRWSVPDVATLATIDWNIVLRDGNRRYDRVVAAYRLSLRTQRRNVLRQIDEEFEASARLEGNVGKLVWSMLSDPQRAASERCSHILSAIVMPPTLTPLMAEERGEMRFELVKLGFALAAFRGEHDSFPEKLAELVPKYLAEVPDDIFSDAGLHYERLEEGHLLYSVGANGKVDGGREDYEQGWDDIVFRIPAEVKAD